MKKGKEKSSPAKEASESAVKSFVSKKSFRTDPSGSYTGHPKDPHEVPEQDSDDL